MTWASLSFLSTFCLHCRPSELRKASWNRVSLAILDYNKHIKSLLELIRSVMPSCKHSASNASCLCFRTSLSPRNPAARVWERGTVDGWEIECSTDTSLRFALFAFQQSWIMRWVKQIRNEIKVGAAGGWVEMTGRERDGERTTGNWRSRTEQPDAYQGQRHRFSQIFSFWYNKVK